VEVIMSSETGEERGSRWFARVMRGLAAWEEALNSDLVERLEKRISALECQIHELRKSFAPVAVSDR